MTQSRARVYAFSILGAALVLLGGEAADLSAQIPLGAEPGGAVRSRADLEERLQYYEDALLSPAYSDAVKTQLSLEAERIRARLREGDFKLGDRVVLFVQGEPALPDTVPVQAGPKITLPLFGDIPLEGVLRSEVGPHIAEALSVFLRDPVVRAEGLMRLSVQGAVTQPGFYVVPANMLLSETLMVAGGPIQNSDLEELRIERGVSVMLEGPDLQEALRQGLSLDQLNMQAGDQVVLPQQGGSIFTNIGVIVGILTSVTFLIIQISNN